MPAPEPTLLVEDEFRAEPQAWFSTFEDALEELRRRADLPWYGVPNKAPCTSWRTCGRDYDIVEYDTSAVPWREIWRVAVLRIDAAGTRWSALGRATDSG
ncbi:MAG: hypothetical protein WD830_08240 [Chloroflexota bacterium]